MRPNLIALSRCKVLSVNQNVIEIDAIDAFPDTPVLDLKPWQARDSLFVNSLIVDEKKIS